MYACMYVPYAYLAHTCTVVNTKLKLLRIVLLPHVVFITKSLTRNFLVSSAYTPIRIHSPAHEKGFRISQAVRLHHALQLAVNALLKHANLSKFRFFND